MNPVIQSENSHNISDNSHDWSYSGWWWRVYTQWVYKTSDGEWRLRWTEASSVLEKTWCAAWQWCHIEEYNQQRYGNTRDSRILACCRKSWSVTNENLCGQTPVPASLPTVTCTWIWKHPFRRIKPSLYEVVKVSKGKQNTIKVDRNILQRTEHNSLSSGTRCKPWEHPPTWTYDNPTLSGHNGWQSTFHQQVCISKHTDTTSWNISKWRSRWS